MTTSQSAQQRTIGEIESLLGYFSAEDRRQIEAGVVELKRTGDAADAERVLDAMIAAMAARLAAVEEELRA
jgi:hypothetical protein